MKFAYIEWVDSVHMDAWNPADTIKPATPEISCGILVQEDENSVTIALSYAADTSEYGHVISIPRVAITHLAVFSRNHKKKPRSPKAPRETQKGAGAVPEGGGEGVVA